MKNIKIKKLLILSICTFLFSACSEEKPPASANIYEKAVNNHNRPEQDRKEDKLRKPAEILAFADLQPGMKIADISGGDGYYTELASYVVGEKGLVYLQNGPRYISKNGDKITARLTEQHLNNVTRIDSVSADLNLPNNLDMILLIKVFHDIYVPQKQSSWNTNEEIYFSQLHNALKIGGKILLIDHSAVPGSGKEATNSLHRIDPFFVLQTFEHHGFRLIKKSDILKNEHDTRELKVFDKKIRGNTDRFVYLFEKDQE